MGDRRRGLIANHEEDAARWDSRHVRRRPPRMLEGRLPSGGHRRRGSRDPVRRSRRRRGRLWRRRWLFQGRRRGRSRRRGLCPRRWVSQAWPLDDVPRREAHPLQEEVDHSLELLEPEDVPARAVHSPNEQEESRFVHSEPSDRCGETPATPKLMVGAPNAALWN